MIELNKRRTVSVFVALVATFALVRVFLHSSPNTDLNIGRYNIHHLFTGVLLITVCGIPLVVLHGGSRLLDLAAIGFGVGLSLALDEWFYLIMTDGSNASYLLPVSFWGGVFMVCLASGILLAVAWLTRTNSKS